MPALGPLPAVPGVCRVVLEGTSIGRNWANVYHVQYTGAIPTAGNLGDFGSGFAAANSAALLGMMNSESTIEQIQITDLSSVTGAQVVTHVGENGTRTGLPIPASAAFLVNYPSSFRYRGGHPRSYYFWGVQTDILNQANWSTTFVGAASGVAANVTASFAAGAFGATTFTSQCAVSYVTGGATPRYRTPPIVQPITITEPSSQIASMRRRMRKG
jgi:hypothetical protein